MVEPNPIAPMSSPHDLAKVDQVNALGVTQPPEILVECEAFTGSLATLFMCVREGKVNLLGVPLSPICQAYLQYLVESAGQDIDRASAALAVLAYLLERKAWSLLPNEQEEPELADDGTPQEPWVHEFLPAIEALRALADDRGQVYFRPPDSEGGGYELPFELGDVTLFDLSRALQRLLERAKPEAPESLRKPARSLSEMMVVVLRELPMDFKSLDEIVVGEFTRSEVVWWFLALLELIRLGQARVRLAKGEVEFAGASAA